MDKFFPACLLVASDFEHTDVTVMMENGALYDSSPSCVGEEAQSRRFVFTLLELSVCSGKQFSSSLHSACLRAHLRRAFEHVTVVLWCQLDGGVLLSSGRSHSLVACGDWGPCLYGERSSRRCTRRCFTKQISGQIVGGSGFRPRWRQVAV